LNIYIAPLLLTSALLVTAADAESDADALHEVRLNLNTNQFTVDVAGSKHKRQSSLGSLKQHSLSPSVQNNGTGLLCQAEVHLLLCYL